MKPVVSIVASSAAAGMSAEYFDIREQNLLDDLTLLVDELRLQRHGGLLIEPQHVAVAKLVAGFDLEHLHDALGDARAAAERDLVVRIELGRVARQRGNQRTYVAARLEQYDAPIRKNPLDPVALADDLATRLRPWKECAHRSDRRRCDARCAASPRCRRARARTYRGSSGPRRRGSCARATPRASCAVAWPPSNASNSRDEAATGWAAGIVYSNPCSATTGLVTAVSVAMGSICAPTTFEFTEVRVSPEANSPWCMR